MLPRSTIFLLVLSLGGSVLRAPCRAQSPPAAPPGVLVLRNGHVLHGQISRYRDGYIVALSHRGEIRLTESQVDFACPTLEEAYRRKRRAVDPRDAREHLDLAEWCFRQDLLGHAADHLLAAKATEPDNAHAAQLQVRLLAAIRLPKAKAAKPPPRRDPAASEPDPQEIGQLPHAAVQIFKQKIQPLLLNRCSAARCHGPASRSEFRVAQPLRGSVVTKRLTERNLYSLLKTIDRDAPEKSPLLASLQGPHGEENVPVFSEHEQHLYEQLAAWARVTGRRPASRPPDTIDEPELRLSQTPLERDVPSRRVVEEKARPSPVSPSGQPFPPALQRGASTEQFVPKDPFDPEIFNRQNPAARGR